MYCTAAEPYLFNYHAQSRRQALIGSPCCQRTNRWIGIDVCKVTRIDCHAQVPVSRYLGLVLRFPQISAVTLDWAARLDAIIAPP